MPLRAIDSSEGVVLGNITIDTWALIEAAVPGYSFFTGTTVDRTTQGHTYVVGSRRCR